MTILLVEQNARKGLECADVGFVVDLGRERFQGPAGTILAHPEIRELYLGRRGRQPTQGGVLSTSRTRGRHVTQAIQLMILGILLGGVYGLMATGLTLVYGVMGVINLAHAVLMIAAAYLAFFLWRDHGVDPFLSMVATIPVFFASASCSTSCCSSGSPARRASAR